MKTKSPGRSPQKLILFLLLIAISSFTTYGQLTGIKTIPGNYATITAAVNALNAQGVGNGGVTFNVSAGYTEVVAARINMTATGTLSNPIVFQKNGAGVNPKITAFPGNATPASATPDGIWSFKGSDYVTIDGIDLYDPNATNPATMEYGFGFFRNTAYDGAQNNTVRNCTVTLNRVNNASGTSPMVEGSVCILVINSVPTAATSAFAPFAPSGTNSYNRFYSNLLQNCNYGIVLTGSIAATPFDLGDTGNDVGGASASTGNSFLNYGGGTASNPTAGVRAINQWEVNISYNTINNNNGSGLNPTYQLYGIFAESGLSANATLSDNTITLKANSYTYYGIYNGIGSTAASNTINLNNNTISNCTGNGTFYGIYLSASPTTVNINDNTISNISSSSTASTLTAIHSACNATNPVNMNIGNNHISYLSKTAAASSSCSIYGISYCAQVVNCHDNIIENLTMNYGANSASIIGISSTWTLTTAEIISNNIIRNCSISSASNGYVYAINGSQGSNEIIQNNQIYNFTMSSNGTFYGIYSPGQILNNQIHDIQYANAGSIIGIYALGNGQVSGNQLYAFKNTTGTSSTIIGIRSEDSGIMTTSRNSITNLSSGNTSAIINGISLNNGTKHVYNNFISDLRTPNSSSTTAIFGINTGASGSFNIYYNSVFLNANSTGATFGTSAIYVNTTGTVDLRNNNFVNISIPNGGGYTSAYRRSGTSLATYSNSSNNNNFFAGTPGLYRLIFYDGTNSDQTLASYKTRVAPRDAVSITENPPFINTTTTPYDLHLSPTVPTQCESRGIRVTSPVAIPDDFDGNIRFGETGYAGTGTAPDIGADEGNFIIADVDPPYIQYPVLGNSCTAGNRILVASLTDVTGVPVSGSLVPRIYYRKNSESWYSQPGTLVSGTGLNGSWSFIIVSADMGGLIVGDVVSCYVIAQDVYSPMNIGSNPAAGLVATDVNNVITPPVSPNSYTVLNSISGVYQVGAGKTFETITAAAAAYNNPNNCLGTDPVFELTDATYSSNESFPIVFNANPFAGPGNTLTIRPAAGITATILGSSATSLVKFNAARYITIDGSNNGGTDRNLFITNSYSSGTSVAVWIGSTGPGSGSGNIVIKNCNISTGTNSITSYCIFAGSSTAIETAGDDNDNLLILNNNLYKARVAISVSATAAGVNDNLQIMGNTIGSSTAANYITTNGIIISYASGSIISQNTIFNIIPTFGVVPVGISLGNGVVSSMISKNYLRGITSQGGAWSRGIYVNTGNPASNLTFANNIVCEISGFPSANISSSLVGMMLDGTTGGVNIYYNSISLSNTLYSSSSFNTAAILLNTATISGIDLRSNILSNSINNPSNSSTRSYAIYSVAPAATFTNINYNDYFTPGTQGTLGYMGGNIASLSAWRVATEKDGNSIVADPYFVSTNDLRPGTGSMVIGSAQPIPGIADDYLNVVRSASPTMGAYENGVDVIPPAINYTLLSNTVSTSERTLLATITDASGVPVSGSGLPVLYWKINSGSWLPATGISQGAGVFLFTFGAGVAGGDFVYYYVVAQDQNSPVPNVSCNPLAGAAGFGYDPPAATTPPTTPSSYKILIELSGQIIVGSIGSYPNLTGNNGLFKAMNENMVTGNITASIASDLTEDGLNALNQWVEQGGSGFTLTIRPLDKNDKLISGNYPGLIRLNGADRVVITGEYPGAGNFLTFRNLSNGGPLFLFQNDASNISLLNLVIEGCNQTTSGVINIGTSSGTTGNDNITISNCTIRDRSDATGVPYYAIYSAGTSGKDNSEITITGNQIFNFQSAGIFLNYSGIGDHWSITDNHLYNEVPSSATQTGISFYVSAVSNSNVISGNYVGGQSPFCGGGAWQNTGGYSITGISVYGGNAAGTSVQGNTVQNISLTSTGNSAFYGINLVSGNLFSGTITGNTVGSMTTPGSITVAGTGSVYGLFSGSYATATIKNTVIANIIQTASNPGVFTGIYLNSANVLMVEKNRIMNCGATSSSSGVKDITGIYYAGAALGSQPCTLANNLVSLGHGLVNNHVFKGIDDFGYSGNNLLSYFNSVNIGGTSTGSSNSYACLKRDVTNETHKNNLYINSRTGGTGKHYSIGNIAISGTYISDFNDLFTAAGPLAIWNIVDQADLNAWKTASGQDFNSKSVNPGFVSATDLHPTHADLDGAGLTISGIPDDFAGVMRGSPPDIGAYEFTPAPVVWNGIVSTDWNNPLNWTPNGIPSSGISVSISAGTPNACIVTTSGAACKDMILDGSVFSINLTVTITVYGNLTKQNNAVLNNNGVLTVNGDFINY